MRREGARHDPDHDRQLGPEEEALVLEVLRSGQLAQGAYVERFERSFAEIHGVEHAVAVNNGTTALVAALEALGSQPGDEVITTPFTFVATLNAILEAGATARFADIGDDFNIVPAAMEALVNDAHQGADAGAPVRLHGRHGSDHGSRRAHADSHVVEDAAQAIGATLPREGGRQLRARLLQPLRHEEPHHRRGWRGHHQRRRVADRLRLLRNQGMRQRYQYEMAGHNYRLTNLAAAVGLPQLDRLEAITAARAEQRPACFEPT